MEKSWMNQDSVGTSEQLCAENMKQHQGCVTLTAQY